MFALLRTLTAEEAVVVQVQLLLLFTTSSRSTMDAGSKAVVNDDDDDHGSGTEFVSDKLSPPPPPTTEPGIIIIPSSSLLLFSDTTDGKSIVRVTPVAIIFVASFTSVGICNAVHNALAVPLGITPRHTSCCSSFCKFFKVSATCATVPSPPHAMRTLAPCDRASRAASPPE